MARIINLALMKPRALQGIDSVLDYGKAGLKLLSRDIPIMKFCPIIRKGNVFQDSKRVMNKEFMFSALHRVSHAFSWKFMKPHILPIVQEVIFPLMCHSDADEELWNTDPQEYIRVKYGKWGTGIVK